MPAYSSAVWLLPTRRKRHEAWQQKVEHNTQTLKLGVFWMVKGPLGRIESEKVLNRK